MSGSATATWGVSRGVYYQVCVSCYWTGVTALVVEDVAPAGYVRQRDSKLCKDQIQNSHENACVAAIAGMYWLVVQHMFASNRASLTPPASSSHSCAITLQQVWT